MTGEPWQDAIARGYEARRSGRGEEALVHFRNALSLAPDRAETNSACGLMKSNSV